jgi:FkbM family methyltransferase
VELHSNTGAQFTKWVVLEGLLARPFVLVDIGVQGGESERWHALGDRLVLHGFDAIDEVVEGLRRDNRGRPNRYYHWIAAGKCDGEQTLYFDVENPFSSSLYQQDETRLSARRSTQQPRQVPVRRLDSLLVEGIIPPADFLKIDVEGYEKDVLLGATQLLKGVLGFEAETAFTVSCEYPNTHFGTLLEIASQNHQRTFDIEFNRVPRASFQRALVREHRSAIADQVSVGRPATVNVLFCRDLLEEVDSPANYVTPPPPLDLDRIIKQVIVYELYGLNDVAVDTVERLADGIGARIDVDKAIRLLADPACRTPGTFTRRIGELEEQLERFRIAHAESMAETSRCHAAERDAAVARIHELQAQFEAHKKAYISHILEQRGYFELLERLLAAIPRPIRRLARMLLRWTTNVRG